MSRYPARQHGHSGHPTDVRRARSDRDRAGHPGRTAGTGGKTAKLETGAVVRVPLFIEVGEKLKLDTRTGEYVGRVK